MVSICIPKIKATQLIGELGIRDHNDLIMYLEDICAHKGVFVQYSELNNCEGRLVVNESNAVITVAKNKEYPGRTRYSIAHEMGHFDLHRSKKAHWECGEDDLHNWLEHKNDVNMEMEANQFASELLLPSNLLKQDLLLWR